PPAHALADGRQADRSGSQGGLRLPAYAPCREEPRRAADASRGGHRTDCERDADPRRRSSRELNARPSSPRLRRLTAGPGCPRFAARPRRAPMDVQHDPKRHRFFLEVPGGMAELVYRRLDDHTLELVHTGVPDEAAGHGIAGSLAKAAFSWARQNGNR